MLFLRKIIIRLGRALGGDARPRRILWFKSLCIKKEPILTDEFLFWRRRRDLNPRYPFGVYTISNRARSASYATSPSALFGQPSYITPSRAICQALFCIFLQKVFSYPIWLHLTISIKFIIIYWLSGCGEVWYRAWFGSKRPRVRIPTLRPTKDRDFLGSHGLLLTFL